MQMSKETELSHGADPQAVYSYHGMIMKKNIIDFSTNTNVVPIPASLKTGLDAIMKRESTISGYPTPDARGVVKAVSQREGIHRENILATNGSNEAIYLVASYFAQKRVGILNPTYPEYEKAFESYHSTIVKLQWKEFISEDGLDPSSLKAQNLDLLVLCNPNNPTGHYYSIDKLKSILEETKKLGIFVLLDEAYIDFVRETKMVDRERNQILTYNYRHIIVLRSLTKIDQVPGLRLAYVLSTPTWIKKLRQRQPSWAVNGIAQAFGEYWLNHPLRTPYVELTKAYYEAERRFMEQALFQIGMVMEPTDVNFYLLPLEGKVWIPRLLEEGIVVRHTENHHGLDGNYVRIALRKREENKRLIQALEKCRL